MEHLPIVTTGRTLRDARMRYGWTQTELAARVGTSQPYIGLLERHDVLPLKMRERLQKAFAEAGAPSASAPTDLEAAYKRLQEATAAFAAIAFQRGDAPEPSARRATGGRNYRPMTDEEWAERRASRKGAMGKHQRNQQRSEARAVLGDIAMRLIFLAQDGNWAEYHEKRLAAGGHGNPYVDAFVVEAEKRVVELADPLVLLEPEA